VDTERPYHYARWTTDHRLLVGGADRPLRAGHSRDAARRSGIETIRRYFTALFPSLNAVEFEYGWDGSSL
jgi:glycine/D-amino acid oxidase-like deaminating enzyme